MRARFVTLLVAGTLFVAGCSTVADTTTTFNLPALPGSPTAPEGEPLPELDVVTIAAGEELYAQSCAACHGADLQGDPDWQVMREDGSFPPPPQDSSGHTWHHGDDLLVEIILDGSEFPQSRMPAFAGQLIETEVLSILEFFKSTWGPGERTLQWEVTLRERANVVVNHTSTRVADGQTSHQAHDKHEGHSPEFRDRLWVSLVLTVPILYSSTQFQEWFGDEAVITQSGPCTDQKVLHAVRRASCSDQV